MRTLPQQGLICIILSVCGSVKVPQGRIVGGNETFEGEVPWMSAIYLHGGGQTSAFQLSLFTSHCFRSERVLVRGSPGD